MRKTTLLMSALCVVLLFGGFAPRAAAQYTYHYNGYGGYGYYLPYGAGTGTYTYAQPGESYNYSNNAGQGNSAWTQQWPSNTPGSYQPQLYQPNRYQINRYQPWGYGDVNFAPRVWTPWR